MHEFKADFYGRDMQAVVLGYIRPELDYTSRGQCFTPLLERSWLGSHPSGFQRLS